MADGEKARKPMMKLLFVDEEVDSDKRRAVSDLHWERLVHGLTV